MSNVSNPAGYGVVVVPNDVTVLSSPARSLYIGTSGNVTVRMYLGQNTVQYTNVPVGVFPVQVDMVMSTGTAASGIVAMF